MPIARRRPLSLLHDWNKTHGNDVFKHELRSKAATEAYFNAFAAGTVTFSGVENTDYEFHADHGFRSKTNAGRMLINLGNIITDTLQLRYLVQGGYSFSWELLASQWIEPASSVVYDKPVTDLNGEVANPNNTYLIMMRNNTSNVFFSTQLIDDVVSYRTLGRNKLLFQFSSNTNSTCARPVSQFERNTYIKCRATSLHGNGQMWYDEIPGVPPIAGATAGVPGERSTLITASGQAIPEHTSGTCTINIGSYDVNNSACTRWVRNIRFWNTVTDLWSVHPKLARVISFGDSYSATTLGPGPTAPTVSSLGGDGQPGAYSTTAHAYFADIEPSLKFMQRMNRAGFRVGGMYGSGGGGKYFSVGYGSSLLDLGFTDTLIKRYYPSMVFTFGMHNDIYQYKAGLITIAALQSQLLTNYLKPIMDQGCYGWGFVIPTMTYYGAVTGDAVYFDAVATMLLGLPAAFNAAYPQYAGKVKVRDARNVMGLDHINNKNWRTYWLISENVHPSNYANVIFANYCADMALEWLRSA